MDDAIIDEIVAAPSDDGLRRSYAEALRTKDARRSVYVEAEIGWAATRDDRDWKTLNDLSSGLDPVWVARISRPPMGVCCDRVTFERSPDLPIPRIRDEEIDWLERRFSLRLPADYRAFLLNYNGGHPVPNRIHLTNQQPVTGCNDVLAYFCSIWAARESATDWDLDLVWRVQFLEREMRRIGENLETLPYAWMRDTAERWRSPPHANWMIVGNGAPTGQLEWFCLECRGRDPRQVFCVDPESLLQPDHCLVAATFAEFLHRIGEDDDFASP